MCDNVGSCLELTICNSYSLSRDKRKMLSFSVEEREV